jgi:uncharacterized repeat protein (TIGR01451 family)
MKKIKLLVFVLFFFFLKAGYCQTYIRITHNPLMDSLINSTDFNCSKAMYFPFMLSGIAKGYNSSTDSVTLKFYFGDGLDTTLRTGIHNDSLFTFSSIGIHHYASIGAYYLKLFVIAPDNKKDSAEKFNFLIGDSCENIYGSLYEDANFNCINDAEPDFLGPASLDVFYNNQKVTGFYHGYTPPSYWLYVPAGFEYDVIVNNNNSGIFCPTSIHITSVPSLNNDFGFQCYAFTNLTGMATSPGFRPGSITSLCAYVLNYSCSVVSGKLKIIYDDTQLSITTATQPYSISGDTIIMDFINLTSANNGAFSPIINFYVSPSLQIGDTVCFTLIETPSAKNNGVINNIQKVCFPIVNSCDPNNKLVYPQGEGVDGFIDDSLNMAYTVHFQNTGNAPALNIYILDTLDSDLDIGTFSILDNSHSMTYSFINNRVIRFDFQNINLPDSASDQQGSNGFVTYSVRQKLNLIPGTKILNTAYIYFDYNPAIVTNTTVNTIQPATVSIEDKANSEFEIYPNPSTGIINIDFNSFRQNCNIDILNSCGQLILSEKQNNRPSTSFDLSGQSKGLYVIKVQTENKVIIRKIIIE